MFCVQVMIAVDDSASMNENGIHQVINYRLLVTVKLFRHFWLSAYDSTNRLKLCNRGPGKCVNVLLYYVSALLA